MHDIVVSNIMSDIIVCSAPEAPLRDVTALMRDRHCSCVVITENDVPTGIVTEFDFIRLLADGTAPETLASTPVAKIMSRPVVTITERTSLFDALVVITARKLRHLPVVDQEGRIKGIVTLVDLAQAHFQTYEKQRETIEQSITFRTRELVEANEKLKALSLVDALMGIGNRRAMEVDLEHTHAQAVRYGRPYSVALFDIDLFKRYNDTYGHLAGDDALKRVAGSIAGRIRASDRLYRYGGEELLLLLPETGLDGAEILVERIMASVREAAIPHCQSPYGVITLSCGIVALPDWSDGPCTWRDVVAMADREMYRSKETGRNRASGLRPRTLGDDLMNCLMGTTGEPLLSGA